MSRTVVRLFIASSAFLSGHSWPWQDAGVECLDDEFQLTVGREPDSLKKAALIWAQATALRDERPSPSPWEEKLPGIQERLKLAESRLLLARCDGAYVGFILFAPRTQSLEIFYVAVTPNAWGKGVASRLLAAAEDHARDTACVAVELWVITDNYRAQSVYLRSGFIATEVLQIEESSGRVERRMRKQLR